MSRKARKVEQGLPADAPDGKATALAVTALWLALLHVIFNWQSPHIIAAKPGTHPAIVTAWVRWAVYEHDGIETFVAFIGTAFFIATTAAAAWWLRNRPFGKPTLIAGAFAAAYTLVTTRSTEFQFADSATTIAGTLLLVPALVFAWYKAHARFPKARTPALLVAYGLLTVVILLSSPEASHVDFGFYIGPALHALQGDAWGTFYMQYNLLGTLIIQTMMRLGMSLAAMTMGQNVLFALFILLYWQLCRRLFDDRFMRLLAMAALVLVRFFDIRGHPAFLPQVMPTRLDTWVLLALAVEAWGLRSWKTAFAFAAVYFGDATFGLLHSAVYFACLTVLRDFRALRFIAPVGAVAVFQKATFGSFVSAAAAHYIDVQIGFLPISANSLFWPVLLLLGCATAILVIEKHYLGLMLCMMAVGQLTYFYGRSHDHNLINVAGVWIVPVFLAMAHLRGRYYAATVFLSFFAIMAAKESWPKLERTRDRLASGVWMPPHQIENDIEVYRQFGPPNMMVFDTGDAYINYRLGLRQRGYFSPIDANFLVEDCAKFFHEQLAQGLRVIARNPNTPMYVQDLNRATVFREHKLQLRRGQYYFEMVEQ